MKKKVTVDIPEGDICGKYSKEYGYSIRCPFFRGGYCTRFKKDLSETQYLNKQTRSGTSWDGDYTTSIRILETTYHKLKKCKLKEGSNE